MNDLRNGLMPAEKRLVSWSCCFASMSLMGVASAWLLAELTPSPLVNSLLVAARNIPAFLPLKRHIKGFPLMVSAVLMLELVGVCLSWQWLNPSLLICITLIGVFVLSIGITIAIPPLVQRVLEGTNLRKEQLQYGKDLGGLSGTILAGLFYPAFMQFPPALLLMLPVIPLSRSTPHTTAQTDISQTQPSMSAPPLKPWSALHGFLDGALFALLPLWALTIDQNNFVDYSMIMGAFMIGRLLRGLLPWLSGAMLYGLCGLILLSAFVLNTPLWLDVLLFIPLGGLFVSIDLALIEHLKGQGDLSRCMDIHHRSDKVASVAGGLVMGASAQIFGLITAMPVLVVLFLLVAAITWRWRPPSCFQA